MKLKHYSEVTIPRQHGRKGPSSIAQVSFSKNGQVVFNKRATEMLELKQGDKVSLCQDEEEPENWYIHKDPDGFEIKMTSSKLLAFMHRVLVKEFKEKQSLNIDESVRLLIAGKPTIVKGDKTKYWGLLQIPN